MPCRPPTAFIRGAPSSFRLALTSVCVLLLLNIPTSFGIIINGTLNATFPVAVVGKYCFRATKDFDETVFGEVYYDITYPEEFDNLQLLFVFENLQDWNVLLEVSTCSEFAEAAKEKGNVFNLRPFSDSIGGGFRESSLSIPFSTGFNRFFYFILANCDDCDAEGGATCTVDAPLKNITFTIAARNPHLEPFDEVSFNEYLAPAFSYLALGVSLCYLVVQTYSSVRMFQKGMFHHTVSLLQMTCILEFLAILSMSVLYVEYQSPCREEEGCVVPESRVTVVLISLVFPAVTLGLPAGMALALLLGRLAHRHLFSILLMGLACWPMFTLAFCFYPSSIADVAEANYDSYAETFRLVGTLCFRLADWMFLMLLILLAKGWTIVRRSIKPQTQVRLGVFMTANMVAIVFSVITQGEAARNSKLEHYWQSFAGILILVLQILFYFWFVASTLHTIRRFKKQKSAFYVKFFLFYSGWTLCMPALMLILPQLLDAAGLSSIIYVMEHSMTMAAHIGLVIMYFPNAKCNKGFPFHAMIVHMKSAKRLTKGDLLGGPDAILAPTTNGARTGNEGSSSNIGSDDQQTAQPQQDQLQQVEEQSATRAKKVRQGGSVKFLVQSSVLTANPLLRCRVKLDAVQFRIHRVKMSVDSLLAALTSLDTKAKAVKARATEKARRQHQALMEDDSPAAQILADIQDGSEAGPVVNSASRAAQRFKAQQQRTEQASWTPPRKDSDGENGAYDSNASVGDDDMGGFHEVQLKTS